MCVQLDARPFPSQKPTDKLDFQAQARAPSHWERQQVVNVAAGANNSLALCHETQEFSHGRRIVTHDNTRPIQRMNCFRERGPMAGCEIGEQGR